MPETTSEQAQPYHYTYRTAGMRPPRARPGARQGRGTAKVGRPLGPESSGGPGRGRVPKNAVPTQS